MYVYSRIPTQPAKIIIRPMQPTCQICLNNTDSLFSIANCSHKYCLMCCQSHIKQRLLSSSLPTCLNETCESPFDQHCEPFLSLGPQFQDKLKKCKQHRYFQQNPNLKSCKVQDCDGVINRQLKPCQCNVCKRLHCYRCLELAHDGECSREVHNMMNNLHYKQCGKCLIYVEKIQGCNYISCTCGNQFCYTCGIEWARDPCRLRVFQETNRRIRDTLKQIRYQSNFQNSSFFRRVIITLYQILFLPLWIFFGALVIPVVSIVVLFVLYTLLSPLMIILLFALGPLQNRCIRNSGIIITVILYPIISAIMVLILLIFVILFLFVRHRFEYHHGIYDPFMQLFLNYVLCFLSAVRSIVTA